MNKDIKKSDREIMKNFIATPIANNQSNSMNDVTVKQSKKLDINLDKIGIEKNQPLDSNS